MAWVVGLAVIIAAIFNERTENTSYYGIAESREIVVNSEKAVEIRRVNVVPGQEIDKGTLLVELDRPELTIKINEITHQVEQLKARIRQRSGEIKSQIDQLEAQKASKISEINYQIKQLKTRESMNKELASELKSIANINKESTQKKLSSPINIKIESLNKECELACSMIQMKIKKLNDEVKTNKKSSAIQVERLEKELSLLVKEKNGLAICAPIKGVIGSVSFKEGEKVSPFSPILTLHTKSPSYVKGYIHENVYNRATVKGKVKIVSLASSNVQTTGEVVGVGSRIVEFPLRLRKRPDIQVWGREVQIKIPEENNFLLGEKVLVTAN